MKVWDLPTRLFHWFLVFAYIGVFYTSYSEWLLEYHTIAGYIILGLVIFRLVWGFTGNRYARFSEFLKGWSNFKSVLSDYLRFKFPRYLGHNPVVGWAVVFMLIATALISITGIITYSGEENRGLWAGVFTYYTATSARAIHTFLAYTMVVVIVGHICMALFHDFILRENIILSMITGTKEDPESWSERVSHMQPGEGRSFVRLLVWIFVAIMGGLGLIYLPPEGGETDFSRMKPPGVLDEEGFAVELKPNQVWLEECATSCHSAYHPTLLPADSWRNIFSSLDDHFGEDVTLDENTRKEILDFLTAASAEHSTTEASSKMLYSIKANQIPIRITEVPYWKWKHAEISEDTFRKKSVMSKSNCVACHPGAEIGSFEDKDIHIPN